MYTDRKNNSKKILCLFFVAFNLFIFKGFSYCMVPRFNVRILNNLPKDSAVGGTVRIHCASADTDLGYHRLQQKKEFRWSFCMNFWLTTMYFCHFWWNKKDVALEVFSFNMIGKCEYKDSNQTLKVCLWDVREDGLYLGQEHPRREARWGSK